MENLRRIFESVVRGRLDRKSAKHKLFDKCWVKPIYSTRTTGYTATKPGRSWAGTATKDLYGWVEVGYQQVGPSAGGNPWEERVKALVYDF